MCIKTQADKCAGSNCKQPKINVNGNKTEP